MQQAVIAKSRIDIVDALRGFALLGIILAHMNNQYYAGFPPPDHGSISIKNPVDGIIENIGGIFIVGKFFTIFSFLFGLSFGIQLLNAKEKNQSFLGRFAWRLLILGAIGFLHQIHYRGDILVIYSVLGFFLLLFYKAGPRWLLAWSFFFILNSPGFIFQVVQYVQNLDPSRPAPTGPDFEQMGKAATLYFNKVKAGDYLWIVKTNITEEFRNKFFFQLFSGRLFITMGLFVLGLYVAKKRIFENLSLHINGIRRWLWISLATSILIVASFFLLLGPQFQGQVKTLPQLLGIFLTGFFDPALSMVYVCAFILLFNKYGKEGSLKGWVALGRMGLTTYIVQSIFGLLIFYGYGLNLLDEIGNSITYSIGIAVFILQVYFSRWWMKRYYYGPLEWFWRSATYLKWQPFRKKQALAIAS